MLIYYALIIILVCNLDTVNDYVYCEFRVAGRM